MSLVPKPRVVLAPDVIALALIDPESLALLELWPAERLVPVVNRDLLLFYFRLMRKLGFSENLVRSWGWWFSAPDRVAFIDERWPALTLAQLCVELARVAPAGWIITTVAEATPALFPSVPEGAGIKIVTPGGFLQAVQAQG